MNEYLFLKVKLKSMPKIELVTRKQDARAQDVGTNAVAIAMSAANNQDLGFCEGLGLRFQGWSRVGTCDWG